VAAPTCNWHTGRCASTLARQSTHFFSFPSTKPCVAPQVHGPMQLHLILKFVLLLAIANGTPVLAEKLLGRFLSYPLDAGKTFVDGRPLFGSSKTIRGIAIAVIATSACAPVLGITWPTGSLIGVAAMAGDLVSSFVKRRMGRPPSSRALGLDQIPESLLPALACKFRCMTIGGST
jgi:CDP-diglyceride synthetase